MDHTPIFILPPWAPQPSPPGTAAGQGRCRLGSEVAEWEAYSTQLGRLFGNPDKNRLLRGFGAAALFSTASKATPAHSDASADC